MVPVFANDAERKVQAVEVVVEVCFRMGVAVDLRLGEQLSARNDAERRKEACRSPGVG